MTDQGTTDQGRLTPLTPDRLTTEQSELYAEVALGPRATGPQLFALTREDGSLTGPFNAMLLSPGLGRALQSLGSAVRYRSSLPPRTRELAILQVAAQWGSGFERHAHEAVGRSVGLTDDELATVAAGSLPELADPSERACAELVAAMLAGDVEQQVWDRNVPVVGEPVVFELSTLVGYYATLALQLRIFRVG